MADALFDNENIRQFNPQFAKVVGLNVAIVAQQVHYWTTINKAAQKMDHYFDGYWWVYNTYNQWKEEFPFWSKSTVERALRDGREIGIILAKPIVVNGETVNMWYTVNRALCNALVSKGKVVKIKRKVSRQIDKTSQNDDTSRQIDTLTKSTSKTTKKKNSVAPNGTTPRSYGEQHPELSEAELEALRQDALKELVKPARARDEFLDFVADAWALPPARAAKFRKFLIGGYVATGKAKDDKRDASWIEHNITPGLSLDEVKDFVSWYRRQTGDKFNLPGTPETIATWVHRWRLYRQQHPRLIITPADPLPAAASSAEEPVDPAQINEVLASLASLAAKHSTRNASS